MHWQEDISEGRSGREQEKAVESSDHATAVTWERRAGRKGFGQEEPLTTAQFQTRFCRVDRPSLRHSCPVESSASPRNGPAAQLCVVPGWSSPQGAWPWWGRGSPVSHAPSRRMGEACCHGCHRWCDLLIRQADKSGMSHRPVQLFCLAGCVAGLRSCPSAPGGLG